MEIWSGPEHGLESQDEAWTSQPGLQIPELFWGPHSGTFSCKFFAAFPGNSSNNVNPADPTKFVAFPEFSTDNVDKKPDLAFLLSGQTIDQVVPAPGGRDSGRLGSSVRTWLAEAATAADLKGGLGAKPPQEKV